MKKIVSLIILLQAALFVVAQENTYSLQQAIEYANQHQSTALNAALDEQMSSAKVKEIVGIGLPQIKGEIDVKHFFEIPTSFIPGEFFGGEPGTYIPVQFGTPWQASAGVTASQIIFDPTYLVGVSASKTYRELSQKNLTRTRIETAVAVSKAYYSVLVNRERIKLLDANVDRVQKLKEDTKALFDNGFVEKIDHDRVVLAYNNINTERENVSRLMKLSDYYLKFQMGLDVNSSITLSDSLSAEQVRNIIVSAEKFDVTKRVEYSLLQTQQRLMTLDLKRYRVQYIPGIYAYGTYSTNAQRSKFDFFDSDGGWYPTGIVGATLSWNLFDGTQRERKIQQAKMSLQKTENDLINTSNALALEAETNRTQLLNSLASLNTQKENLDLANEVVRVSKLKYDQGVGSNLEVINAETSLREAQTNYYNALYDALVAKVELDKAMGNIK